MDRFMSEKIIYWLGAYNPEMEAIAKEVRVLHSYFSDSFVFSMTPYKEFEIGSRMFKCYRKINPLRPFISLLARRFDISHIFGWGGETYYLNRLNNGYKVLTVSGGLPKAIPVETLKKAAILVVESETDKARLIAAGIRPDKIRLIYPGIMPLPGIPKTAKTPFTILFASAPLTAETFASRGMYLLMKVAQKLPDIRFLILWRVRQTELMERLIDGNHRCKNVFFINRIVKNMQEIYQEVDAVIAPFTTLELNKPCPLSIIEGLSREKPTIVSELVGIKDIIERERCGVVSRAGVDDVAAAILQLKQNYEFYRSNCLSTVRRYFSLDNFIKNYQTVYAELAGRRVPSGA
jgi:glycosyltransferase involved in cell wall biosynthesis